jgi:hypothetical protein
MVNGYAQTSEKIALSKLLGGRVLAPVRAAPRRAADVVGPHDFRQSQRNGRLIDEPMAFARVIEARPTPDVASARWC